MREQRTRYPVWTIGALATVLVVITLIGILKSRRDSYNLLVQQGTAFTEALALACQNTIVAETYYDRLVADRYSDLIDALVEGDARRLTAADLSRFADRHDLLGVYMYDTTGQMLASDAANGPVLKPPSSVEAAVHKLIADFANRSTIVFSEDSVAGLGIHYYLQVTNQLDRVIVLAVNAALYDEARARTGIGVLAQKIAEEPGIEYVVYQAREGIIFSSQGNGSFMAIESDPFLRDVLDSDTIMTRRTESRGKEVLELVRPFSSRKYPFGLLRVGVSLDGYFAVSRGFDRLMIVLSLSLFGLLVVGMLYAATRRERAGLRRDITEIKSVTDQIFAEISTGVAVIDRDRRFRLANRAFEQMLGGAHLAGKRVTDLPTLPSTALGQLIDGHTGKSEGEITVSVNGVSRTLLAGRSELSLDDPSRSGVVIVVTDITELKTYEQTAARKERLSEMGHLAAGVAHEIRNPLNAISIAAQRLESEIAPVDHREEFLGFTRQIRSETKRLNDIITRFLSLARGEGASKTSTDLTSLCAEVEQLISPELTGLGIKLTVSCQPGLQVAATPDQLKELLLNLCNNAKEAIAGQPGEVAIIAQGQQGRVRIAVADSGPGIPAEIRSKVFAPYFTTKEGGTGIGLATVHQIAEELGGAIDIQDSPLGGAAIIITLPGA